MFEVMSLENDEGLVYYACTAAFARSADVLNRPDATSKFIQARMILWTRTSFGTVGRDNAVASMAEVINNQTSQFLDVHAKANAAFTGAAIDDPVEGSLSQNALIGVRGISLRPHIEGLPTAYTYEWLNSITTEVLAGTSVPISSSGIDHLEVELDGSDLGSEWLVLITINLRRFGVVALPGTTTSFRGVVWNARRIVRYDKGDSPLAKNLREMLAGLVSGLPK
jgi:hypothetical protein